MARYCTKCGASITADALFCESCGVAVKSGATPVSTSAVSVGATVGHERTLRMVALVAAGVVATIGGSAWWWLAHFATPSIGILKSAAEASLNTSGRGSARSLGCIPWLEEPYFSSEQVRANFEAERRDSGPFAHRVVLIVPTKHVSLGTALVKSGMAEGPVGKGDGANFIQGQVLWFVITEQGVRSVFKEGKTRTDSGETRVGISQLCFSDGAYVNAITTVRGPVDVNGKTAVVATVHLGFKNQQPWTEQDEIRSFFDTKVRQRDMVFMKSDGHWNVAGVGGLHQAIDTEGLRKLLVQRTGQPENATTSGSSGPTATNDASGSSLLAKLAALFSSDGGKAPASSTSSSSHSFPWFGKPSVIGKWHSSNEDWEFFEDNTVTMEARGGSMGGGRLSGKWVQLSDGRIKIDLNFLGMPIPPAFASLNGNSMGIQADEARSELTRIR